MEGFQRCYSAVAGAYIAERRAADVRNRSFWSVPFHERYVGRPPFRWPFWAANRAPGFVPNRVRLRIAIHRNVRPHAIQEGKSQGASGIENRARCSGVSGSRAAAARTKPGYRTVRTATKTGSRDPVFSARTGADALGGEAVHKRLFPRSLGLGVRLAAEKVAWIQPGVSPLLRWSMIRDRLRRLLSPGAMPKSGFS